MITLLRKIRKRLIVKGSFSSYLLYAIGEILLVVIGILIALQINTWNQDRINRSEEQRILNSISDELKLSKFLLDRGSKVQESKLAAAKNLLQASSNANALANESQLEEDFSNLIKRWLTGTPTSIYDALIGSGDLSLISSEQLRKQLMQYKSDQEFLRQFEEIQVRFFDEQLSPSINQHLNRSAVVRGRAGPIMSGHLMPTLGDNDYQALLKDRAFTNLLVESIEHGSRVLFTYQRLDGIVHQIDSLAMAIGN